MNASYIMKDQQAKAEKQQQQPAQLHGKQTT